MARMSGLSWLIRCVGVVAALLLACGLATARFGSALQQPSVTTRDGSLITLNRYLREPIPDIVLVGSSVAWRLKEEYFSFPRFRNLALAGGSPVTVLEILAKQPSLPKIILIETNILSRKPDSELIAQFSGSARTEALFLRPVRTAVATYETLNHAPPTAAQSRAEQDRLLREPPSTFDNKIYLGLALRQMNEGDPTGPARVNVARIRELIDDIQRRESRAFLIEIPFEAEIENSRLVTMSKAIVQAAFPDRDLWLGTDPPRNELRWTDGVHLDERSALIVSKHIEQAIVDRR
ncbi:hypothetical protein M2175_004607 [Bradyrhizobium elkanii]|uniref:hypothetical protein n=1 Tax=Bradyrhizobium TaxID=374 RepID=UPI002168F643|nr:MULTISPECIES: hypothetical protein [Bradyrhizobium]MCS3929576.1 hypothetical protein [Bradyrhizobium elkanii]MCS3970133.1 hypothetical protein [Bradyrhizobium japonicum]